MNSLLAISAFEFRRLLTPGRAFWWILVAAFPVVIVVLMQEYGRITDMDMWQRLLSRRHRRPVDIAEAQQHIDTLLTIALYFLAPTISCMMGALLTAAPSVASELEQHSWVYFATRPNGLFHLLMGKYLVAVVWAGSATLLGVCLAIPLSKIDSKLEAGSALLWITLLSAMSYSALYLMIGALFHRRAMVFCVAYTAGVELFLGFFPAVINRMTIQYRLRSLLYDWTTQSQEFRESRITEFVAANESVLLQITWLVTLTALFLAISLVSVHVREFTAAVETDV